MQYNSNTILDEFKFDQYNTIQFLNCLKCLQFNTIQTPLYCISIQFTLYWSTLELNTSDRRKIYKLLSEIKLKAFQHSQTYISLYNVVSITIYNDLLYIFFCEINVGSINILPGSETESSRGGVCVQGGLFSFLF